MVPSFSFYISSLLNSSLRYHRQWVETVTKRYLDGKPQFEYQIHRALADYFSGKWALSKSYESKKRIDGVDIIEEVDENRYACSCPYCNSYCIIRYIDPQPLFRSTDIPNSRMLVELPYLSSFIFEAVFFFFLIFENITSLSAVI